MKILNFGSLNLDHVYRLSHIVKEGETISSQSLEKFCGGKGLNQSIAMCKAGLDVYHAGGVGEDGAMLTDKLSEYGADVTHVRMTDVPTGHAIIQVDDNGQNSIVLFGGANQSQDKAFIDSVLNDFENGDYLVLQNEINNMPYIIENANKQGLFIILNPSPYNSEIEKCDLSKVSMLFINEIEGEQITGKSEPEEIIKEILNHYPDMKTVLTLGADGAVYADKNEYTHQKALGDVVKDTTAAGDTFLGYFIAGMTKNMSAKEALLLASKASAITISKIGAADTIPTFDEI